jgi:hypothetical protein
MADNGLWSRITSHPWYKKAAKGAELFGIFGLVKLAVSGVIGALVAVLGARGGVKPVYIVVLSIFAAGCALWVVNQIGSRRARLKLETAGSGSFALSESQPPVSQRGVSHKQKATVSELAQGTIRDRQIDVSSLSREADGFVRQKTFLDCDLVGPAVVFLLQCELLGVVFRGPPQDSIEAILIPKNPDAVMVVGVIGFAQCRFDRGTFTDVGFTGPPEMLDTIRSLGK